MRCWQTWTVSCIFQNGLTTAVGASDVLTSPQRGRPGSCPGPGLPRPSVVEEFKDAMGWDDLWGETATPPQPTPSRKKLTAAIVERCLYLSRTGWAASLTLRVRLRCAWQTRGAHSLDLHSGRCHYCKRPWVELYPNP